MKVAHLSEPAEERVIFRDGLGVREWRDIGAGERVEWFHLDPAFAAAESPLRDRVTRLAKLQHVKLARVLGLEPARKGTGPVIVSSHVPGTRFSEVLEMAEHGMVTLAPGTALQITREILGALLILHDSRNVTHGALGPERIVLTGTGRVVLVEHGLASALERLNLPRHQLWRDWRIATPPVPGQVRFDVRTDLAQLGLVALAAILGRPIEEAEYPHRLRGLLPLAQDRLTRSPASAVAADIVGWLERLVPVESRRAFTTVKEAQQAYEATVSSRATSLGVSPSGLKAMMVAVAAINTPQVAPAEPAVVVLPQEVAAAEVEAPPEPAADAEIDIEALLRLEAELEGGAEATPPVPAQALAVAPADSRFDPLAILPETGETPMAPAVTPPTPPPSEWIESGPSPAADLEQLERERADLERQFADLVASVAPGDDNAAWLHPTRPDSVGGPLIDPLVRWSSMPAADLPETPEVFEQDLTAPAQEMSADDPDADRDGVSTAAAAATPEDDTPFAFEPLVIAVPEESVPAAALDYVPTDWWREALPWRGEESGEVERAVEEPQASNDQGADDGFEMVVESAVAVTAEEPAATAPDVETIADTVTLVTAAPEDVEDVEDVEVAITTAEEVSVAAPLLFTDETVALPPEVPMELLSALDELAAWQDEPAPAPPQIDETAGDAEPAEASAPFGDEQVLTDVVPTEVEDPEAADESTEQGAASADLASVVVDDAEPTTVEATEEPDASDDLGESDLAVAGHEVDFEIEPAIEAEVEIAAVVLDDEPMVEAPPVGAVVEHVSEAFAGDAEPTEVAAVAVDAGFSETSDTSAEPVEPEPVGSSLFGPFADLRLQEDEPDSSVDEDMPTLRAAFAFAQDDDIPLTAAASLLARSDAPVPAATWRDAFSTEVVESPPTPQAWGDDAATVADVAAAVDVDTVGTTPEEERTPEPCALEPEVALDVPEDGPSPLPVAVSLVAAPACDDEAGERLPEPAPQVVVVDDGVDRDAFDTLLSEDAASPDDGFVTSEDGSAFSHTTAAQTEADAVDDEEQPAAAVAAVQGAARRKRRRSRRKKGSATPSLDGVPVMPVPAVPAPAVPAPAPIEQPVADVEATDDLQQPSSDAPPEVPAPGRRSLLDREVPTWTPPADFTPVTTRFAPPPRPVGDAVDADVVPSGSADRWGVSPFAATAIAETHAVQGTAVATAPRPVRQAMPVPVEPPRAEEEIRAVGMPDLEELAAASGRTSVPPMADAHAPASGSQRLASESRHAASLASAGQPARGWNWRRLIAASVLIALFQGAAFAAWWWVQPGAGGTLVVQTARPGVEVLLDGKLLGKTPLREQVAPGRHELMLRQGDQVREMPVEISLGVVTTQALDWPAAAGDARGNLQVSSTPAGAEIFIDGKSRGKAPQLLEALPAGNLELTLRGDAGSVTVTATVIADETSSLDVPIFAGWVLVDAPIELAIAVRGARIGTSTDGQLLLSPGRHQLEALNEALGFRKSFAVVIEPGEVRRVTVAVPPAPLQVQDEPGSEVFVDGERVGTLPGGLKVPLGTHDVLVRRPDQSERRQTVTVRAGDTVTM